MHWTIKAIYACLLALISIALAVRIAEIHESGEAIARLWPVPIALLGLWIGWKKSH